VDRYYQGTDPISTDNGYSNMSTAIMDDHYKTISCIVDYRDSNHKQTFLQCMLAGIYYDVENKGKVPELVEANIGTAYMDYQENKGFERELVQRTELAQVFQGGGGVYGLDNRGARNRLIIDKMYEFIVAYGDRVYIPVFFEQLRTFNCTVTDKGNTTWGTSDKRIYHDDVLFSVVFAYICTLTYSHRIPREIKSEQDKFKMNYKLVMGTDGMLTRRAVKVRR